MVTGSWGPKIGADLRAHVLKVGLLDDMTKFSAIVCSVVNSGHQRCNAQDLETTDIMSVRG